MQVTDFMSVSDVTLWSVPGAGGPHFDTFFVYPAELRDTKRVTVMRDFLLEKVREWTY